MLFHPSGVIPGLPLMPALRAAEMATSALNECRQAIKCRQPVIADRY